MGDAGLVGVVGVISFPSEKAVSQKREAQSAGAGRCLLVLAGTEPVDTDSGLPLEQPYIGTARNTIWNHKPWGSSLP